MTASDVWRKCETCLRYHKGWSHRGTTRECEENGSRIMMKKMELLVRTYHQQRYQGKQSAKFIWEPHSSSQEEKY